MKAVILVAALVFVLENSVSRAADLTPRLGTKGKLLLEETFHGPAVPKGWTVNTGALAVRDGALRASEKAADQHIGAFRYRLPLQDCAVQVDFRFDGGRIFHLGFDPAPGELKKKGHLFSVTVSPSQWTLIEHNDKADPASKTKTHAAAKTTFEPGQWYTLLLESKGDTVVAQITGKEPLRATAKDFRVKKPGLVFRVGGKDTDAVSFDNVKVWELK
jgi:hypothetical protein